MNSLLEVTLLIGSWKHHTSLYEIMYVTDPSRENSVTAWLADTKIGWQTKLSIGDLLLLDDWWGGTGFSQGPSRRAVPSSLATVEERFLAEKKRREAEAAAKANDPLSSPVGANPALSGGGGSLRSLRRSPEPPQVSAKSTSWTRPTRAVRWNLQIGAQATVRSRVRASACTGKGKSRPG
jgi:hypothetical protein